jgi:hypothetical protein
MITGVNVYGYINHNIDRVKYEITLGLMPTSILRHWEIYSRFDAYKKMGFTVVDAVLYTANEMRCCESSVFKVIKRMEAQV